MKIGIPKETLENEERVAATPETIQKLVKAGISVIVEKGAGDPSFIFDDDYKKAGAVIALDAKSLYAEADVIFKVQRPLKEKSEISLLKSGTTFISFLQPLINHELVRDLAAAKVTSFSMDMIPRISRSQKHDALSSQSNVAGYKAVIMAADTLGKMMPMMMTAAGMITPAKVFVVGAGVAGLQAIATAKRLGGIVEAFDTRPAVKEQVESLGAKFVQLEMDTSDTEDKGGYAKELSKEAHEKEKEMLARHMAASDIVITTALIPGRPAPMLIPEETVKAMKNGAVIVDLAAEGGGNCALTEAGKTVVKYGVTIVGKVNVPSMMPAQSSQLYARNILNLFLEISKDNQINLDMENEITKGSLITHNGEVTNEAVKKVMGKVA